MTSPEYQYVENDSCRLRFWKEGSGPLLFFVPGGSGHGSQFNKILTLLSSRYTCVTYDRRGTIGSPSTSSNLFNPPQQANDIAAIIRSLAFEKAIIFGNSLGANLTFQMGIDHPSLVDHLIAHEAPTITLLPDFSERYGRVLALSKNFNPDDVGKAFSGFSSEFQGFGDPGLAMPGPTPPENLRNFFENEFLLATLYNPDWRKILRNGVSIGVLAGERSGNAFYALTTIEQSDILGCPRGIVPGHHLGFEVEAEAFAPKLVEFIELLEERRTQNL